MQRPCGREAQQCSASRPVWLEQRERRGRWQEGRLHRWAGANQVSPRPMEGTGVSLNNEPHTANKWPFPRGLHFLLSFKAIEP